MNETDRICLADDCQLLLWDLAPHTQSATESRTTTARLNSPRPDVKKRTVTEPVFAYTAPSQISNLAWSPPIQGMTMNTGHQTSNGEWIAITCGKSVKALKV